MPQSLSSVIVHVVFGTKDRAPFIADEMRLPLHGYLATVARTAGCACFRVGGVADHVHVACALSRTLTIAGLVEPLKTSSSKWLKSRYPRLRDFAWQRGYGAFSVARRDLDALITYIDRQEEHHRTKTFQEEYLALLDEFGVDYDPRYMWE